MLTAEVLALTTKVEMQVAASTPPALPARPAPWLIGLPPTCRLSSTGGICPTVGRTAAAHPHPDRAATRVLPPGRSRDRVRGCGATARWQAHRCAGRRPAWC